LSVRITDTCKLTDITRRTTGGTLEILAGIVIPGFAAHAVVVELDFDVVASTLGAHGHDAPEDWPHLFGRKVVLVVVAVVAEGPESVAAVAVVELLAEAILRALAWTFPDWIDAGRLAGVLAKCDFPPPGIRSSGGVPD
jgi:hypothetical protein